MPSHAEKNPIEIENYYHIIDPKRMFKQAVKVYSGIKVRDCFSVILINAQSRCVVEEFCIPRVDGTEVSIFRND